MCAQIKYGGLALGNLETKITVSYLNWLKRLYFEENSVPSIFAEFLIGKNMDIKTFICTKTNSNLSQQKNSFYHKVFQDWHCIYNKTLMTEVEVRNEMLWENVFITCEKKPLSWKTWKDSGILKVQDIIEKGQFMSEKQIFDTYGLRCNFLQALQIRMCLPGVWRQTITDSNIQLDKDCLYIANRVPQPVNILTMHSRELYWIVQDECSPKLTGQSRWYKIYPDLGIMNETWSALYMYPFKVTRETKLQSFQFKIFHRIIACNNYLKNIRVKDDPKCNYCDDPRDTIIHFFATCPRVVRFWNSVLRWLNVTVGVDTSHVIECEQILGLSKVGKDSDMINMILLRARFFIYRQRLFHKCNLNILQWLLELKHSLLCEEYICKIENKLNKFRKWRKLLNVL